MGSQDRAPTHGHSSHTRRALDLYSWWLTFDMSGRRRLAGDCPLDGGVRQQRSRSLYGRGRQARMTPLEAECPADAPSLQATSTFCISCSHRRHALRILDHLRTPRSLRTPLSASPLQRRFVAASGALARRSTKNDATRSHRQRRRRGGATAATPLRNDRKTEGPNALVNRRRSTKCGGYRHRP